MCRSAVNGVELDARNVFCWMIAVAGALMIEDVAMRTNCWI